jgi:SAM-dependent methyltransferase
VSLTLDEHREYLSDAARMAAYAAAIGEVVRAGDVVLDLGAGTGILGLLACRAGARRVYAIDAGNMIEVAREVCCVNGCDDRITFVKKLSLDAELPERVDVIVADQIGRFGFDAGILEYFADARKRFLKPGGHLIPKRVRMWAAPVEAPALRERVEFWLSQPAGFDFAPVRRYAANTGYPCRYTPDQLLSAPQLGTTLDLAVATDASFEFAVSCRVLRAGMLHGIGGWFDADLSDRVQMSNSPLSPEAINRRTVFFPVDRPIAVAPGDSIDVRMCVAPNDTLVTWKVAVPGKAVFTHSTWHGMLLSREQLAKTQPDFVPRLTRRGIARGSVLDLCDGRTPLASIEEEMLHRYPDLFQSRQQAAVFVTEVVSAYGE